MGRTKIDRRLPHRRFARVIKCEDDGFAKCPPPLPSCLSSWASIVLGTLQKRFLFFLLPLPLSSSSPLDDAVIKGLSRSLPGALKSPANDKVFVLIARGTTDTERGSCRRSWPSGGNCGMHGWLAPRRKRGQKSALKILFIFGATVIISFYCVERVPQCGPLEFLHLE